MIAITLITSAISSFDLFPYFYQRNLENFNNDIRTLSRAINNKLVLVNQ